jgi:predicted transposase/invertase (TIGR01784 family)
MIKRGKLIKFDWFINKILRDKSSFVVLEGFLTALLKKDIAILSILEREGNHDNENNRFNRVVLLVEDSDKEKMIVEIQNEREPDYLDRILFGTSKVISDYLKIGAKYMDISKVISVGILYVNLGAGDDYIYYGTTNFEGIHNREQLKVKSKVVFNNGNGVSKFALIENKNIFPEYYLINVERFPNVINDSIDEWIYLLKNSDVRNDFKSKYIKEAEEQLNMSRLSENDKRLYEKHLENLIIEEDVIFTAKEEGRQEERLNNARSLLKLGVNIELVETAIGISKDEILKFYGNVGNVI